MSFDDFGGSEGTALPDPGSLQRLRSFLRQHGREVPEAARLRKTLPAWAVREAPGPSAEVACHFVASDQMKSHHAIYII